jgi:response regulator RpfG family c-di-GMP phosphodiesterase
MSKQTFKEMWRTVQSKKSWQGIVKNLKKDGSDYIVQATIMPILDSKGDIQEYISCRTDITEVFELRTEIEETQKEIVLTLGELCESRSEETGLHVKRVAEYSRILALAYELSEEESELLAKWPHQCMMWVK